MFDMRNERFARGETLDRLLQATLLRAGGPLLMKQGRIRRECPAGPGLAVALCDLGLLPMGDYAIDILLDPRSLDRALGTGGDDAAMIDATATFIIIEVVSTADQSISLLKTAAAVKDGVAAFSFSLRLICNVGCRIFGQEQPLALYGLHVRGINS